MAKKVALIIRLPETLRQELEGKAAALDRSLESVVIDIIQLGLRQREEAGPPTPEERDWLEEQRAAFFQTPLGRYILDSANPNVTLEEVLEITSKIKGSLAAEAIAEREERF